MAIKPFQTSQLTTEEGGIAGKKWVMRQLRRALGKLNITGEGLEISQSGDGALHLRATAGSGAVHPFRVSASGTGISVSPGYFYAPDWTGGTDRAPYIMPVIGNTPLDASTPPIYSTSVANGYVLCRTQWTTSGAPKLPWPIAVVSQLPQDVPCIMLPDPNKQEGAYHVLLARIVDGEIYQQVRSTVHVDVNYQGFRFSESNAMPAP
jgi:hypothetical protein